MDGYRCTADLLKAIAHPTRLRILEALAEGGEACVCHLESVLGQRQATISQQLARLRRDGLVTDRRQGLNVYYALADHDLLDLVGGARQAAIMLARRDDALLTFRTAGAGPAASCDCPKCSAKAEARAGRRRSARRSRGRSAGAPLRT